MLQYSTKFLNSKIMKKPLLLIGIGIFIMGMISSFGVAYALLVNHVPFPDVNYSDYYGDSLNTMSNRKIIDGYANGNFGPYDSVTRAQMVTILDRYDKSLFSTSGDDRSSKVMYLLCDGLQRENLNQSYQTFYDDICAQQTLL